MWELGLRMGGDLKLTLLKRIDTPLPLKTKKKKVIGSKTYKRKKGSRQFL